MGRTYEPGRSRWTTATGWLMVTSALAAIGCALADFPPVAPLSAELALAGAAVFFAGCWAVASHLARLGPLEKRPAAGPGEPSRVLPWGYAAGHPELGVGTESPTDRTPLWLLIVFAVAVVPWFIVPIFIIKSQTDPERLHALRRFRPGVHLPALAILLTGVVLLLPTALEFEVAGFHRLPAAVAALTPALAMRSAVRRSRRLRT